MFTLLFWKKNPVSDPFLTQPVKLSIIPMFACWVYQNRVTTHGFVLVAVHHINTYNPTHFDLVKRSQAVVPGWHQVWQHIVHKADEPAADRT